MPSSYYSIEIQDFFKSAFSIDSVIFGFETDQLKVLLIKRGQDPYLGYHALPGDLVYPSEDLDFAAKRILKELTNLSNVYLEQVKSFGAVDRHPLGRVITIAYYSLVKISDFQVDASAWASDAEWFPINDLPPLAFDHKQIFDACKERLKLDVQRLPIAFSLLPQKFTLTQLQELYESLLEKQLDIRNFRKKVLAIDLIQELDERQKGVAHRPAKLYRFDYGLYDKKGQNAYSFNL